MSGTIFILNGPNLNLLGTREPEIYGAVTLEDLKQICERKAAEHGFEAAFRQTNSEGELVGWIQEAGHGGAALVLNAGAYTHTSVAILDALKSTDIPIIEVHLSNVFAREAFRHNSYVSPAATGVICGLGGVGYELAIEAIAAMAKKGE
jgi:3-dehydroquinate dehydratase-2